jgi:hypothetical protein
MNDQKIECLVDSIITWSKAPQCNNNIVATNSNFCSRQCAHEQGEMLWLCDQIDVLLKSIQKKNVCIEIGFFNGFTFKTWECLFDFVMSIDINFDCFARYLATNDIKSSSRFILGDSTLPVTSRLVAKTLKELNCGLEIDMLYIDGNHSFSAVQSDFLNYEQFVRKGGVIGFHDVNMHDVKNFINLLKIGYLDYPKISFIEYLNAKNGIALFVKDY